MVPKQVDKLEAARRQLDSAIQMLFAGGDPLSIHTLSMAAFRILRDLADARGDIKVHKDFESSIRPGMEAQFWGAFNKFANFLKHADNDYDSVKEEIGEEANDNILWIACCYYDSFGLGRTMEMSVFMGWFTVFNPHLVSSANAKLTQQVQELWAIMPIGKRSERLSLGNKLLQSSPMD